MTCRFPLALPALLIALAAVPTLAAAHPAIDAAETVAVAESAAPAKRLAGRNPAVVTRSGLEIHRRFREHLAEPDCANASPRWRAHFAHAPKRLATRDDELLAVFGYVVDELIKAGLPTEYALIPFIESGYKPGAKSGAGPAGLWQFIALTARNQGVPMRGGYDGRFSVVDSTRAAVRYLKILHSMFGGNWRVAIMGYNAGEYRLVGAIKRSGMGQRNADAGKIQGVPALTRAYVEKLHAISCLIEQADDRESWLQAMARPVPLLAAETVGAEAASLEAWARERQLDAALLRRLNPALAQGPLRNGTAAPKLLAPARQQAEAATIALPAAAGATAAVAIAPPVVASAATMAMPARPAPRNPVSMPTDGSERAQATTSPAIAATAASATSIPSLANGATHVVAKGDSWWRLAHRYRIDIAELQRRNGLKPDAPLRPGMVLKLDAASH